MRKTKMAVSYGTSGPDSINGTSEDDILYGWAKGGNAISSSGNDILYGKAGYDYLYGGEGDDELNGDAGRDRLVGGLGNDRLVGGLGNDRLVGRAGDDYLVGGTGGGLGGNDHLEGGAGNDSLVGDFGSDDLDGGSGNDFLDGGGSPDSLGSISFGTGEVDILTGGTGRDGFNLMGGSARQGVHPYYDDSNPTTAGLDDYALITDFNSSEDTIYLTSEEGNISSGETTAVSYSLGASPAGLPRGTALSVERENEHSELIAILQGVSPSSLDLSAPYFYYYI